MTVVVLPHAKVDLALHELRGGAGRPLLVLHGLGEQTGPEAPAEANGWPGPVFGLDFTGHGRSTVPAGGGYTCEVLLADADVALAHLGGATLYGRGLGAYVALLLAGARPASVLGTVLADGPGLAGGGDQPRAVVATVPPGEVGPPDPYALVELASDVRPVAYALAFARAAVRASGLDRPLSVAVDAGGRPPWLAAVAGEQGVATEPATVALARFARSPR
jgi:pimeloyl-ACP methyl ester carboxylesterase